MDLYEITAPHITRADKKLIHIVPDSDDITGPADEHIKTLTASQFLDLPVSKDTELYGAIILSGLLGQKDFRQCNTIFEKVSSLLEDDGILTLDIDPTEKMSAAQLKSLLQDPETISENKLISRKALMSAMCENFELLEFRDSRSKTLPDIFVFRLVKPVKSLVGVGQETQKRQSLLDRLKTIGRKTHSKQDNTIGLTDLRRLLSTLYVPVKPRILLIAPPPDLIGTLHTYLNPKLISVYGLSQSSTKQNAPEFTNVDLKENWAELFQEPNGSAEFIFIGDMSEALSSTQYFELLEHVSRIRNRGGCVLIKEESSKTGTSLSIPQSWPLQIMEWAKTRNSSTKSRSVFMKGLKYLCVSDAAPYGGAIRQDLSIGESAKALDKFKNYTARGFFTVGEAAKIVQLFSNLEEFYAVLHIFAVKFGVVAASRFGLIEQQHANADLDDIVQSLEALVQETDKDEAIILDLVGEFYRLSNDFETARRYWVKSLFQTQRTAGEIEKANILMNKIRLYLPCEIDCATSKVIVADPLIRNTLPKRAVILAESKVEAVSLKSLVDRFDGTTVFTPNYKSDAEAESKTQFKPLMGLVPENSDINKSSHEHAHTVSRDIIQALIDTPQGDLRAWLKTHHASIALTIEDFLARHLLILESYVAAANSNPQADIILAGGELGYFDSSLNLLLSRLSHEKVWLQSDQPTSSLAAYQPIFETKATANIKAPPEASSAKVSEWFGKLSHIYTSNVNDYFSAQAIDVNDKCLILGNMAHRYFGESVVTLAGALYEAGEAPIIIDSSTTRTAHTDMSSLWDDCHIQQEIADNIPVFTMLRPKIHDSVMIDGLANFRNWIQHSVESMTLEYQGEPASFAFSRLAARVLARDIPILLYSSLFAGKLIANGRGHRLAALSTREPHDHIVADILKKNGIPVTMVQCTDILRHPRYKTPVADNVTAMDKVAFETFTDYFGVSSNAVTITGSPRSQLNFHPERIKSVRELLDGRGLTLNPPFRVVFATRTGDLDQVVQALDIVAKEIRQQPGVQLIVKTHPRENPLRLAAYAKVLEKHNLGGHNNILDEGAAETLILASDGLISFPSNVVKFAEDVGKPRVVYAPDENSNSEAFKVKTPQELLQSVKTLLSTPNEKDASKSPNTASDETLNRICNVIMKQVPSRPFKTAAALSGNVGPQTYSSLSFKEALDLIKRQAVMRGSASPDMALFKRALNLARDVEGYISILESLALYAPPTLEAAHIFADLSKRAAGADEFGEAIGRLTSKKLAGFANQLQHSDLTLSPHTLPDLARTHLAIGQFEQAIERYDFGLTQRIAPRLRAVMDNERAALNLLKWDGTSEEAAYIGPEIRRIIIVAERGTDPKTYLAAFPDDAEVEIYFDGKAGETLGHSGKASSKSSRDVLDDHAPEVEGIILRANALAKRIATQTLKQLKKSEHIAWLVDIRPAIEMELRAGLITQLRRQAALAKAIGGPYDAVVFACNTPGFPTRFSESLTDIDIPVFVIGASKSPSRRRAFGAARQQGLMKPREKQSEILTALKKANASEALKQFDEILKTAPPSLPARQDKEAVIALTSWRITTIKDSCLSLLKNFPPDLPITVLDTSRHSADAKRFLADINAFAEQEARDIRPVSAQYHNKPNPELRELRNSNLARSIFAGVKTTKEGKALTQAIQLGVWNQIGILLYKILPMLRALHLQVTRLCEQSERVSLVVMPGRDAESLTAQNAAQALGVKTIDVQTAYFSRGHTYTPPNGDVVTGMDEWSKDLFTDWFNIADEKVHVLGTSRFDRFSKLRITNETSSKQTRSRPQICVATQPIQSGLTKEMLTCLNALYAGGIDFDCIVKLHPRQSETIVEDIESIAEGLKQSGRLTITKHGDLAEILLASDMVVTAFSNVAIEAALMDRPVLIANFTGEDIPIPFMEFGIAEEARTQDAFETLAKNMLYDEGYKTELKDKRHNYFKRYPSQWKGEAGKDTAALIREKMRKPIAG